MVHFGSGHLRGFGGNPQYVQYHKYNLCTKTLSRRTSTQYNKLVIGKDLDEKYGKQVFVKPVISKIP